MQRDWLRLHLLKGPTLDARRSLVARLGSPAAVLDAGPARLAALLGVGRIPWSQPPAAVVESIADALSRFEADYIGFTDPSFPPLLNQIANPPLGLFLRGDRSLLQSPQIAVVGSRNPSPSGRQTARAMAASLATAGLTVTSGLARGVDASAHRGSLDAGGGTIAVMATGIDIVYPRCNRKLHDYIAGHGLVVSEFPPGVPPRRQHFPQRNRIISGLALGTLVVEAGLRSGSLITARLAGEQGREVFAVPGSIHVPTSRGCHHLIRQGAKLVESIEDVVTEIGHFFSPAATLENSVNLPPGGLNERVYCLIDYAPVTIDQLIDRSGLTADQVCSILVNLELEGLIALGAGGYQRLPGLSPEVTGKLTHTQ